MKFPKKLLGVFIVLVFTILGLLAVVLKSRVVYLGRAADVNIPSLSHSYLFASPLLARTGDETVKVSAFLLNEQGRGVEGKQIQVLSKPSLNISPIQPQTDKYGQATFEVLSSTPGQFVITASFEDQPFPQTVTLTFK